MYNLIYPSVLTYFIAWEGDAIGHGENDTNQCTATGMANFVTYTDYDAYAARLLEFGVDISQEEA